MTVNFSSKPDKTTTRWEVEVYDKAERWTFTQIVLAEDAYIAFIKAKKMYPIKQYSVKGAHRA